ncbi:MAG TPA: hypothetical protein VHL11_20990 [Phototrophicaceae bacterium]|nr:hypothetical protein [Phototrophicaceae bacterium]
MTAERVLAGALTLGASIIALGLLIRSFDWTGAMTLMLTLAAVLPFVSEYRKTKLNGKSLRLHRISYGWSEYFKMMR